MTLEEAKKQLERYRQVIRKTHHLQKKGEPGHQQQLAQLKRKRSALLEHLDEAEELVREAAPDYYRRWVGDIIEKPNSWELHQFLAELKELESRLHQAIEARAAGQLYTFQQDTPHFIRQNFPGVDSDEWRDAIRLQPALEEAQLALLLRKSDALRSYYRLYEEWAAPLRQLPDDLVDTDAYIRPSYRLLWVLPHDLPYQEGSLHAMLRQYATWEEYPPKVFAYLKLFYASFILQQHYHYWTDNPEVLSYDSVCHGADIPTFYASLRGTAIVSLSHTRPDELRHYILTLQPNVILTPGTLLSVFQAIGESPDSLEMDLFTGKSTAAGTVCLHRRHQISFLQLPELTDGTVSVEEWANDINTVFRQVSAGDLPSRPLPATVRRGIQPEDTPADELYAAIRSHRYIDVTYPTPDLDYRPLHLLPCLLKCHAGEWYVIGKEKEGPLRPYFLSCLHDFTLTDDEEEVPESLLRPYITAYGVHLRPDLPLHPTLTSDTASLFLIRLRIQAPLWKQFRLHPFHFSQEILPPDHERDTWRIFHFTTYLTDELIHYLRGHGPAIEVLSPQVLKEAVEQSFRPVILNEEKDL